MDVTAQHFRDAADGCTDLEWRHLLLAAAEQREQLDILKAERETLQPIGPCVKCGLSVRHVDGLIQDERGLLHSSCALLLRIATLTSEYEWHKRAVDVAMALQTEAEAERDALKAEHIADNVEIATLKAERDALKAERDSPPTDYSLLPLLGTAKKGPSDE